MKVAFSFRFLFLFFSLSPRLKQQQEISSSTYLISDDFATLLNRLDDCIAYLEANVINNDARWTISKSLKIDMDN